MAMIKWERRDLFRDVGGDEREAHGLHGALRRARNLSMPLRELLRRVVALGRGLGGEIYRVEEHACDNGATGRVVTTGTTTVHRRSFVGAFQGRSWSHFAGIYRQKLTRSVKN